MSQHSGEGASHLLICVQDEKTWCYILVECLTQLEQYGYDFNALHVVLEVCTLDTILCYVRAECSARLELGGYDQVAWLVVSKAFASGTQ